MNFSALPALAKPQQSFDTVYDLIDIICQDQLKREEMHRLAVEIDALLFTYTNLVWLHGNIDTLRVDPSFQDVIGLEISSKYGYTSSNEVLGGISKTMTTMLEKINEFFGKMTDYMNKVYGVSIKNCKELTKQLSDKLKDPDVVEKLKKNYTTNGESVTTIDNTLKHIIKASQGYNDLLKKVQGLKAADEKNAVQGEEQKTSVPDDDLAKYIEQLQKESGDGDDRRNNQDGMSPLDGKWFDSTALNGLSNTFEAMNQVIAQTRSLQSTCKSMSNDIKSNTQMSKEMAKTKVETVKHVIKYLENQIKTVMSLATKVGKTCQILIKATQ